jgi:energy-coupling factor transporter ATP-binding protein EcfA2
MMSDTLDKFRKLTKVFDPIYRPYEDAKGGPGASYVPEAHEEYRGNLVQALELNESVKWLVAGQPGCGKTTMLLSVAQHLRKQGRLVVFVDLESLVSVQDLSWVELHFAIMFELLEETKRQKMIVSAATIDRTRGWLERIQVQGQISSDVQSVASALQQLLSMARKGRDLREELRKQVKSIDVEPADFLNAMLEDVAVHRPIVMVDGVDKLAPDVARTRFLKDGESPPLYDTFGATVLTIPISLVYEPAYNLLGERYNNAESAVLPAVRLYDFDSKTRKRQFSDKGLDVLQRVIRARIDPIDPEIITPAAMQRAIVGSGGNMRELARCLQNSVIKASVRESPFIDEEHVAAFIADKRESFRRALSPEFRPVLEKVRKEYKLEGPGEVTKMLLYGLWIMEYRNGEAWYSLPNPVEQLLESLERRSS